MYGYCPICKKRKTLTKHHIFRSAVWRDIPETQSEILPICRQCHNLVELEITRRENAILQKHPDLYVDVVKDFTGRCMNGVFKRIHQRVRV